MYKQIIYQQFERDYHNNYHCNSNSTNLVSTTASVTVKHRWTHVRTTITNHSDREVARQTSQGWFHLMTAGSMMRVHVREDVNTGCWALTAAWGCYHPSQLVSISWAVDTILLLSNETKQTSNQGHTVGPSEMIRQCFGIDYRARYRCC